MSVSSESGVEQTGQARSLEDQFVKAQPALPPMIVPMIDPSLFMIDGVDVVVTTVPEEDV